MNKRNKILISIFGIFSGGSIPVLGVFLYFVSQDLQDTQLQLAASEQVLNVTASSLAEKDAQIDSLINSLNERVSVLDESILPNDKRWAKIKKIRKAVVDVIKQNGYTKIPDINGLTSYSSAVVDFSEQYDVPISLILAVTTRESAFNPHAISHAGAQGLMQIMPETAKECANDINKPFYNVFKIKDNVQLGTWYLWKMLDIFDGDVELAVRAYNAGPTYVKKVLAGELVSYPQETVVYHEIVLKWKQQYENLGL